MSCVFENKVENDVPARYAVRVPVIQIAGNRVVPRFISSLFRGDFFYILGKCSFLMYKNAPRGCVLRRIRKMSQATAAGARMCQGTFFFLVKRSKKLPMEDPYRF